MTVAFGGLLSKTTNAGVLPSRLAEKCKSWHPGLMSGSIKYRSEIDGLRAIAVLSVLLYHAEFVLAGSVWFKGGFVGVDVFFVISGYLISKIIFSEIQSTSRFSFRNFYERRARRILPALVLVMLATAPFAYQFLLPADLVDMAKSQLASLAFSSNIYFYLNATDYGAAPGLLMPFLHTWSLSVEEQFYLAFPVMALLLSRFTAHRVLPLGGLMVASLGACLVLNDVDLQLAFFMPFTRAWELLAGCLLAVYELRRGRPTPSWWSNLGSGLGLWMVVAPVLAFNETTPHPATPTLVPVVGAVLLLAFTTRESFVGRVLCLTGIRYIGAISYSLYLWHYPVFALQRTVDYDFTNFDKTVAIGLTLLLSTMSYHLVEQPFRSRTRGIWRPAALGVTAAAALAFMALLNSGFTSRIDRVLPPSAFEQERVAVASFSNFVGTASSAKLVILILGDSYTRNWSVAMNRFIDHARYDVVSVSYLGCDVTISSDHVSAVATSSDYEQYCSPLERYINNDELLSRTVAVFLTSHRPFEYGANLFRFDLLKWVQARAADPELFVFGNYFQLDGRELTSCLNIMFHQASDASVCLDLAQYPPAEYDPAKLPLYPADLDFHYVDLISLYCGGEKATCGFEWEGLPFMTDWNHLTVGFLTHVFDSILSEQNSTAEPGALGNFLSAGT